MITTLISAILILTSTIAIALYPSKAERAAWRERGGSYAISNRTRARATTPSRGTVATPRHHNSKHSSLARRIHGDQKRLGRHRGYQPRHAMGSQGRSRR